MCNQFLQLSQRIIAVPSLSPLQTQRVVSFEALLRLVDGVVNPVSTVCAGDAEKVLLNGSKDSDCPCAISTEAWAQRWLCALRVF